MQSEAGDPVGLTHRARKLSPFLDSQTARIQLVQLYTVATNAVLRLPRWHILHERSPLPRAYMSQANTMAKRTISWAWPCISPFEQRPAWKPDTCATPALALKTGLGTFVCRCTRQAPSRRLPDAPRGPMGGSRLPARLAAFCAPALLLRSMHFRAAHVRGIMCLLPSNSWRNC